MHSSTAINCKCKPGFFPERQHKCDAGADLKACLDSDSIDILPGCKAKIKTGACVEVPEGCVGLLFARSSLQKKGLILCNSVGVIDSGYTGDVTAVVQNISSIPASIQNKERIVQLVIVPCLLNEYAPVPELQCTDRGSRGFGSTDNNESISSVKLAVKGCEGTLAVNKTSPARSIIETPSLQSILSAIRCMKREWKKYDDLWFNSIAEDGDVYAEICNEIASALVAIRNETYLNRKE